MAILRSRRLEQIFGAPLEEVTREHLHGLATAGAAEAADLEFKSQLLKGESGNKKLAILVAALANTVGGVVVFGVDENEQACVAGFPGVEVSDAVERQMQQAIASTVFPLPQYKLHRVAEEPGADRGFYLLIVAADGSTPHGVLINEAYRYPRRNGASTISLSESEIAAAYRDRFRARDELTKRLFEVGGDAELGLSPDTPWLVVSLVPDVVGNLQISRSVYDDFERAWRGKSVWPFGPNRDSIHFGQCRVGPGKLRTDDGWQRAQQGVGLAERGLMELHTDGAGVHAVALRYGQPRVAARIFHVVPRYQVLAGLAVGIQRLAHHAQVQTGATGSASIACQIIPARHDADGAGSRSEMPLVLLNLGSDFSDIEFVQANALTGRNLVTTVGDLDEIAEAGERLLVVANRLANQIANVFGEPELGLVADGRLTQMVDSEWSSAFEAWLS
jgi:hypothetical protein